MALKHKAALVDLSNISKPVSKSAEDNEKPVRTSIGMHADAIFRDEKIAAENTSLKDRLAAFQGAKPARLLDPNNVFASKWANRHKESFENAEFESLKREIESAGGNVQAILVRPRAGQAGEYEIVFGHRRHRACQLLALPVLAVVDELSDVELFTQMDRENRERAALRPYEVGMMYSRALDEGLFPSARKLSESVGVDLSQLGKALSLARLPSDIVKAFASPLDLQYRWVGELTRSIQKDPERILALAKQLQQAEPKHPSAEVFQRLTAASGTVPLPAIREIQLSGKSGQTGKLIFNDAERTVKVTLSNFDPGGFKSAEKAIQALLR